MALCLKCTSAIDENEQFYFVNYMGPEILSIIEQNLSNQVDLNGAICSHCFAFFMQAFPATSETQEHEECEPQNLCNTFNCIICLRSLTGMQIHSLVDSIEKSLIAELMAPQVIPEAPWLCHGCWVYIRRILQQHGISMSTNTNLHLCVCCNRSLSRRRSHAISEPERNEILNRINPREIPQGGRACYACWIAAHRQVQRATNMQQSQHPICAMCSTIIDEEHTHSLPGSGPVRQEAERIYHNELPEQASICTNCWLQINQAVGNEQDLIPMRQQEDCINLDTFGHTTNTSTSCFVPGCHNPERNRVPNYLKKIVLKKHKVFVTKNARVCNFHKLLHDWDFLDQHQFSKRFKKTEIEEMLKLSIEEG